MSSFRAHVLILASLLLIAGAGLIGCHSGGDLEIPKAHEDYITSFGWHVEKGIARILHPKGFYTGEKLDMMKSVDIDVSPYADKEIQESIYLLQERQEQQEHGSISFHIYEVDGKIIGAHLAYEGYSPGLVKLRKRE
jgi:hypothetical protein